MKDHHIVNELVVKDHPRISKTFHISALGPNRQRMIRSAPQGESLSTPNEMGLRFLIRKVENRILVSPVSRLQDYVCNAFEIGTEPATSILI